jgi:hypothetical protein
MTSTRNFLLILVKICYLINILIYARSLMSDSEIYINEKLKKCEDNIMLLWIINADPSARAV